MLKCRFEPHPSETLGHTHTRRDADSVPHNDRAVCISAIHHQERRSFKRCGIEISTAVILDEPQLCISVWTGLRNVRWQITTHLHKAEWYRSGVEEEVG